MKRCDSHACNILASKIALELNSASIRSSSSHSSKNAIVPANMSIPKKSFTCCSLIGSSNPAIGLVSILDNRDAKVKKFCPSDDTVLKESLQVQQSSKTCVTTATTQLKVLCRKFAVLSEKVKQEAKMREDAEKEVRRLNAIIQDATNPLITSTRSDAQQYLRAQKDELAAVRDELRRTKEELYHVTQAYDRLRAELDQFHHHPPPMPQPVHHHQESMLDSQIQWDREQSSRIHDTIEKAKQREIEQMTASLEAQNSQDKDQLSKVTQSLRDMTLSHANEIEKLHVRQHLRSCLMNLTQHGGQVAQDTINEERTVKDALQHQVSTLHQVNDAAREGCEFLLDGTTRREKYRPDSLRGVQMRDAKQAHYQDVEALKATLHESQSATQDAEKRVMELQGELTAVRRPAVAVVRHYDPENEQPKTTELHHHSVPLVTDAATSQPTLDGRSSTISSTRSTGTNASSSASDHSILRALKSRNKQLQERLQQEADATFQLEEEINMITSSYHTLLHPQDN
ncbi:hypothetical protein DYB32_001228 [Aphanomyces invadans]|uniref:Uncharacterized protein n=1 Tax=Aphanomyces invadans TaxID=157072 RepID=A0A418B726_9STRA|nr:hypothetical protein DYB32_001228 [Aphanomyces invadans]